MNPAPVNLATLASEAKADRNRAVDLYRAVAMAAVAVGHWSAMAFTAGADGRPIGRNALELAPSMSWITWLLQVMPLFFVVGGFSSAMSLDAHRATGGRPQDWVAARLRRMLAPTVVLAATWLVVLAMAGLGGFGGLAAAGATAAAIPLWFLANYTIDTAIAPYVLPRFRRRPGRVAAAGLGLFGLLEAAQFAHVPMIGQANWVLGWLLFQIAGFAWRDGLLPTGRRLVALAVGLWAAAIGAVAFGPWSMSMIHIAGEAHSPTHPPSLALLLFGSAYSATAVAAAPALSARLARRPRAWAAVVGANGVAMSVYLWHMTAGVAAAAVFHLAGWLPTAAVGTGSWWLQKLPLMGVAAVVLAAIVSRVARVEQRALLAARRRWEGGQGSIFAVAMLLSAALKLWANGGAAIAAATAVVVAVWFAALAGAPLRQLGRRAELAAEPA